MADIDDIGACVFDAYGTLFDVNSAAEQRRDRLGDKADALNALWRRKQLEYTWLRSLMGRHADFRQLTRDALDYAMDSLDIDDAALADDLMALYMELSAYPEVPAVLGRLRSAGIRTALLSNGSPDMLSAAVNGAGLQDELDAVISVEDVGIYKPHPTVYQLAVDRLDVAAERICFLSSNAWDAAGAATFGFRVVWVNRFGQSRERLPGTPAAVALTLDELPTLLGL